MGQRWGFLAAAVLALGMGQASAQTSIWNGVLNHWGFDEGKGLIAYDSSGRNNGLLTDFQFDNTDGWRKGRVGSFCLQFDGKDDSVSLGNAFSLPDNASISAWVNVQGFSGGDRFYILNNTTPSPLMSPAGIAMTYDLGTSTFVQSDGSVWITDQDIGHADSLRTAPGLVKADGKWHQITFVRGSGVEAIYVDGVARAKGLMSVDTFIEPPGTGEIGAGVYRLSPSGPSFLSHSQGLIDDIRVYNRLLLPSPVATVNQTAGGEIGDLFLSGEIAGDTDLDGRVSFADYLLLEQGFGKTDATWTGGDFNGDGKVSFSDYLLLEQDFGKSIAVPEPVTLSLLALGGIAMLKRRRA